MFDSCVVIGKDEIDMKKENGRKSKYMFFVTTKYDPLNCLSSSI